MPAVRNPNGQADIIDIRGDAVEFDLKADVETMIAGDPGARKLPTMLLYNEKGLQLFEEITYLDEYYLTNKEIKVLETYANDMAAQIPSGAMVVELGSGNLRKVNLLLQAFEKAGKKIDYYALDLSLDELERTIAQLPDFRHVTCHGLWGTYDDGQVWLEGKRDRVKCILHLGSSIGNFDRKGAAEFLAGFGRVMSGADMIYIGVDTCMEPDKVYHAYNDSQGVTHQFILNGLTHANTLFPTPVFDPADWRVIGEYVYDQDGGRHQAFLAPVRDVTVLGQKIKAFERVKIEESYKYSVPGTRNLWQNSGLKQVNAWRHDDYGIYHLTKQSKFAFPLHPTLYASQPLPTLVDWASLWATWDVVTRQMLPQPSLSEKPIKLRNACIFYLGHIPTFLDIQLAKTTGEKNTEPRSFVDIFERGIDPDVDNPEKCHDHSEVPTEWPALDQILEYQSKVRSRVQKLYEGDMPRSVGRAVWLGFEHEVMHLETLLYMMLQSSKTLPPPGVDRPDFAKLADIARENKVADEWHDIPAQTVHVGLDDPEDGTDQSKHFGWDNEKPARDIGVHAFQAKGRAITNEEYATYLVETNTQSIPASWTKSPSHTNGHAAHSSPLQTFINAHAVLTVFGPVPLQHALDWPVMASYDELAPCAAYMGGHIPTFEEAKSLYAHVERSRSLLSSTLTARVPAVNGHLSNDGVEETPPTPPLFVDLGGANVGFQNWHPTGVTHTAALQGQAGMGGVWEWTSSALAPHPGFESMALYPGYTADFFDGKHNVVLGGSWATHPRIAGRRSFVNWYQRKYPYAWVGARVVRDMPPASEGA